MLCKRQTRIISRGCINYKMQRKFAKDKNDHSTSGKELVISFCNYENILYFLVTRVVLHNFDLGNSQNNYRNLWIHTASVSISFVFEAMCEYWNQDSVCIINVYLQYLTTVPFWRIKLKIQYFITYFNEHTVPYGNYFVWCNNHIVFLFQCIFLLCYVAFCPMHIFSLSESRLENIIL